MSSGGMDDANDAILAQFSVITKSKGPLTKIMRLDPETGKVKKDGSQCSMATGMIKTKTIKSFAQLAKGLRNLESNQALCHGISEHSHAAVVTKGMLDKARSRRASGSLPVIARSKEYIDYPVGPGLSMLDHDKPRDNATALSDAALKSYRADELVEILASVWQGFASGGYVSTPSTSSCIFDKDGNELRGEGSGSHTYFAFEAGRDIPRFGEVLGKRLFLAGYGRVEISRSGVLLYRTLIDLLVFSPERLDFAAGAVCEDGLVQKLPTPTVKEGTRLNTALLPDLTPDEEAEYQGIKDALAEAARDKQVLAQELYADQESTKLSVERKISLEDARTIVEARQNHVLWDGDVLYFAHLKGKAVSVADVLDNPTEYDKKTLADPLEPEYDGGSMSKARFFWNDGKPIVNSFAHGQIKYTFARYAEKTTTTKNKKSFKFISSSNLKSEPPQWIIKNYLEADTLGTLFGQPGSMKTFVALDMGLSIATGTPYHGNKVKPGPVLYICGEGTSGIARRIQAWERHHSLKAPNFFVSNMAAPMLNDSVPESVIVESERIKTECGQPALIIIDTLNRNFGDGDENSTRDMTKFIQEIDNIKDELQCAVLIVHHSGLGDATRGRGNSSLRGAVDFEFVCEKSGATIEDQRVTLSGSKAKDHEAPPPRMFCSVLIDLGLVDEDMKPISSVVLEISDEQPAKRPRKLSVATQFALEALKALTVHGEDATEDAWRQECYARGIATSDKPDAKRKAFLRARKDLLEAHLISTRNDKYWLTSNIIDDPGQRDKAGQDGTCPGVSRSGCPGQTGHIPKGMSRSVPPEDDFFSHISDSIDEEAFQAYAHETDPPPCADESDAEFEVFKYDSIRDYRRHYKNRGKAASCGW